MSVKINTPLQVAELAYAESFEVQAGLTSAKTDITGLSISFTVGNRPVLVETLLPWVAGSVSGDTAIIEIRDANTSSSIVTGAASIPGAGKDVQLRATVHVTTPGTYSYKTSLYRNNAGTGTLTNNFSTSAPVTVSYLRAVQY